ncbi:MAG: class I adenylate-forming enzyme family protein [Mycobacterium sp.]
MASTDVSRGDASALVHEGRRLSYKALRAASEALAGAMRADHLESERVVLMLPNSPELVTAYLACFAAGAVATPLKARYAPPEVERALRRSRPRWLIAHANRLAMLAQVDRSLLADVRLIIVGECECECEYDCAGLGGEKYTAVLAGAERAESGELRDIPRDAAAVIFFTSGSMGQPKGVVHSHASALAMLTSTSEAFGDVRPTDVFLVFEPLVHVSGFIATFTTLLAGGTVVLYDGFDTATYVRPLATYRPTLISTHVDVLAQLLRQPGISQDWFTSLRGVYTGGDTVPASVQREFVRVTGLPICVGYGMTEAIWLTVQREARSDRDGCIGRPVRGVRLRVDDATGELLVSGPMVMQRYWQDDELTAAMLVDGWFHTGDLAHQDTDGVWWFTGRIKDIIVRRTSKITLGEVEATLEQHPGVEIAAVVGVPDLEEGEVPVAFVVAQPNTILTVGELVAFLRERIADYKIPARIHLRPSLPLTATGKISRRDLTETPLSTPQA